MIGRVSVAGGLAAVALVVPQALASGPETTYSAAAERNPRVARAVAVIERCLSISRKPPRIRCRDERRRVALEAGRAEAHVLTARPRPAPRCTVRYYRPVQVRAYQFAAAAGYQAGTAGVLPFLYIDLYRASQRKADRRAGYCLRLAR